jgi:hypothetical protein
MESPLGLTPMLAVDEPGQAKAVLKRAQSIRFGGTLNTISVRELKRRLGVK